MVFISQSCGGAEGRCLRSGSDNVEIDIDPQDGSRNLASEPKMLPATMKTGKPTAKPSPRATAKPSKKTNVPAMTGGNMPKQNGKTVLPIIAPFVPKVAPIILERDFDIEANTNAGIKIPKTGGRVKIPKVISTPMTGGDTMPKQNGKEFATVSLIVELLINKITQLGNTAKQNGKGSTTVTPAMPPLALYSPETILEQEFDIEATTKVVTTPLKTSGKATGGSAKSSTSSPSASPTDPAIQGQSIAPMVIVAQGVSSLPGPEGPAGPAGPQGMRTSSRLHTVGAIM